MHDLHAITRVIAVIIVGSTALATVTVFVLIQLNEIRLEARLLIVRNIIKRGRDELDDIEKQFAHKFVSRTANDREMERDDLDIIFLDYLADRNFLDNFSNHLKQEAQRDQGAFRICKSKLTVIENRISEWAASDLKTRILAKYFDNELKKNWRVKFLLWTLPGFFEKRALNFLVELKEAVFAVASNISQPKHQSVRES
jgi:hypothetical protein